jgi:fermentation-respiration switch protein FrsA (DUF1100 family)
MLRFFLILLILAVVGYIGIAIYIYYTQSSLIYFPRRDIVARPSDRGMAYEEVAFTTEDGKTLAGWFVPSRENRGTILYCHGNGGNISYLLEVMTVVHRLGFNLLVYDYRGYGKSQGEPSEEGTYHDAEGAWRYLVHERRIPPSELVFMGHSLGGAIATWLALQHPPAALVLESTFTSMPAMGSRIFPWLPIGLVARIIYPTIDRIGAVSSPLLVMHSRGDDRIPFEFGRALFAAAPEPKEFVEIQGGHNDAIIASGSLYSNALNAFLTRHRGEGHAHR